MERVASIDSRHDWTSVLAADAVVDRVIVSGSGMLGVHGTMLTVLVVTKLESTNNNTQRFNSSPVSGG